MLSVINELMTETDIIVSYGHILWVIILLSRKMANEEILSSKWKTFFPPTSSCWYIGVAVLILNNSIFMNALKLWIYLGKTFIIKKNEFMFFYCFHNEFKHFPFNVLFIVWRSWVRRRALAPNHQLKTAFNQLLVRF